MTDSDLKYGKIRNEFKKNKSARVPSQDSTLCNKASLSKHLMEGIKSYLHINLFY